jgi:hypothetical protein
LQSNNSTDTGESSSSTKSIHINETRKVNIARESSPRKRHQPPLTRSKAKKASELTLQDFYGLNSANAMTVFVLT